jgi:hypothetical protein
VGAELFHAYRRTDGRTYMRKVTIAFRNCFANAPRKNERSVLSSWQEIAGSKNSVPTEVKNRSVIRAISTPTEPTGFAQSLEIVCYIFRNITISFHLPTELQKAHCMKERKAKLQGRVGRTFLCQRGLEFKPRSGDRNIFVVFLSQSGQIPPKQDTNASFYIHIN